MSQRYISRAIVEASPEARDNRPGYTISYSGTEIGWMSQADFRQTHRPLGDVGDLSPHRQQAVAEYLGLADDFSVLSEYLAFNRADLVLGTSMPAEDVNALEEQYRAMRRYKAILGQRLERAGILPPETIVRYLSED